MRVMLLASATLILCAPIAAQSAADTFEVIPSDRGQTTFDSRTPILIEATSVVAPPNGRGVIQLERDGVVVALIQSNYFTLIVNRSEEGARTFLLHSQDGEYEVRADEVRQASNASALFYTGGRLVGVVNTNVVHRIVDQSAVVRGN